MHCSWKIKKIKKKLGGFFLRHLIHKIISLSYLCINYHLIHLLYLLKYWQQCQRESHLWTLSGSAKSQSNSSSIWPQEKWICCLMLRLRIGLASPGFACAAKYQSKYPLALYFSKNLFEPQYLYRKLMPIFPSLALSSHSRYHSCLESVWKHQCGFLFKWVYCHLVPTQDFGLVRCLFPTTLSCLQIGTLEFRKW